MSHANTSSKKKIAENESVLNEAPDLFGQDDEFDSELLAAFKIEADELLEVSEGQLLILESEPTDATALNALFRAFHTIKGNAAFLKIDPTLGKLAHDAETVLALCRTGELTLQGSSLDLILESSALMRVLLNSLGHPICSAPTSDVMHRAIQLQNALACIAKEKQGISQGECETNETHKAEASLQECVDQASDSSIDFFQEECPKVAVEKNPVQSNEPTESRKSSELSEQAERDIKQDKSQSGNETLRVDRGRLDLLVELIGELVIAESMAQQDALSPSTDPSVMPAKLRNMAQLNRITRTLQELSLSLRMVPLKSTFQKMTRIARDVMRKQEKQVDFIVEGEHTELDKTVVDEIGDPLMHMVRNAIDHGIEKTTEERIAAGKPARGRVVLRAFHQSGNIHIEIQDDGRGLNAEKILAKAKQQKIVTEDANLSESEVLSLIFEPGFSTADKVTDVSGRGVGMDVVRRNIQALRGSVDIKTKLGQGSCFTIRMPLTLAIIDGLVVRVGTGRFVIPTLSVTELMQLNNANISTIAEKYTILTVRDQNVPLVRLDTLLGLPSTQRESDKGIIVVVQDGPQSAALSVDEVLGQQQVVIKQLGHNMKGCKGVAGGAIMPDGQIGIILDIHGIITQSRCKN